MIPETEERRGVVSRYRPLIALVAVVLAGAAVIGLGSWLGRTVGGVLGSGGDADGATVAVPPGLDVEVEIPAGASATEIAEILQRAGVVANATQFQVAVRASDAGTSLRAGTYELVTGMEPDEVIEILRRGPVVRTFDVLIREGLRIDEILDALAEASGLDRAEFERVLTDGSVRTSLVEMPTRPELSDWEGLLFPDTYRFSDRAGAADILNRIASTMEARVAAIDWSRLAGVGLGPYEGIIIASLIESEVRVAEERPLVSSVIQNRLADGMRLELDATVLYALASRDIGDFDRSVDSPYNTYLVAGLPPTPISAPGRASLEAASD
ncbi:MAG: endolytic transglycosylase MltG, partial [Acidimicrobiia bacterium]